MEGATLSVAPPVQAGSRRQGNAGLAIGRPVSGTQGAPFALMGSRATVAGRATLRPVIMPVPASPGQGIGITATTMRSTTAGRRVMGSSPAVKASNALCASSGPSSIGTVTSATTIASIIGRPRPFLGERVRIATRPHGAASCRGPLRRGQRRALPSLGPQGVGGPSERRGTTALPCGGGGVPLPHSRPRAVIGTSATIVVGTKKETRRSAGATEKPPCTSSILNTKAPVLTPPWQLTNVFMLRREALRGASPRT